MATYLLRREVERVLRQRGQVSQEEIILDQEAHLALLEFLRKRISVGDFNESFDVCIEACTHPDDHRDGLSNEEAIKLGAEFSYRWEIDMGAPGIEQLQALSRTWQARPGSRRLCDMSTCPHFRTHESIITQRPIGRNARSKKSLIPWCDHPDSPVPLEDATLPGGGKLLKCGGDLAKCQIADPSRRPVPAP